ncbi:MAG: ABC transporter permease [Bacillota bacterium]
MRLDSIAIQSLRRRKAKMLFLILGMVIAMGTVVTLYSVTTAMNREMADTFDEIGPNIMVVPKGDDQAFSYGGVVIPGVTGSTKPLMNDDIISINTIKNRDNIAFVAPKLLGLIQYQGDNLTVVGVDFPYEMQLKTWWRYDGKKPFKQEDLLLGSRVAQRYGLQPGDQIKMEGQALQVAAVLEPQGTEEDGLVFMTLLTAQKLMGKENQLSFIEVAAYCTTCPIEEIVRQIGENIPNAKVTALAEAVKARQETIDRFTDFAYAVSVVVVLAGALVILLTMMASVNERTREIGIYRAIGFRKSHIYEIFLTEAGIIGIVGGILGYVAGMMVTRTVGPVMAQMQIQIDWNPLVAGSTILIAAAVGLLSSAYPATQAANLDPAEALRFI